MSETQERTDELQETWVSDTGLNCEIFPCRFSSGNYHLCGYVEVPREHPLYGCDHTAEVPLMLTWAKDAVMKQPIGKRGAIDVFCMAGRGLRCGDLFNVHGSITYSRMHKDSTYWYGFDCGHCDDSPDIQNSAYVRAECESLAHQIVGFARTSGVKP